MARVEELIPIPVGAFRTIWRPLRHETLYVLWALTEVTIIAPVFLAITPWTRYWSPSQLTILLLLLMLIPLNLSRLATLLKIGIEKQQILMVLGLALVLLVAWRNLLYGDRPLHDLGWIAEVLTNIRLGDNPYWSRDVIVFLTITFIWWRGISLVGRRVTVESVGLRMRAGILLVAFLVVGLSGSQLEWSVTPFVLLFLFAVLMSVSLTRVEQLEIGQSGHSFSLSVGWLVTLSSATAATVFTTAILTGFASGESLVSLVGWLGPLWLAIRFTLTIALSVVSYASVPIILLMEWILGLFFGALGPEAGEILDQIQQIGTPPPVVTEVGDETLAPLSYGGFDLRDALIVLSLLATILLVSMALRRLYRLTRSAESDGRDVVSPFDSIGPFRRPSLGRRIANRLGLLRRWRAAASVRRVYREMTELSASYGFPRLPTETPLEFLPALGHVWPDFNTDTILITEAYNRVRYGEFPETDEELAEIVSAWERLLENVPTESEAEDIVEASKKTGRS